MHANHHLVIAGSTRATRRSPVIAAWVGALGKALGGDFEEVDLRALALGLDDEPGIPARGEPYASPATRHWSEKVAAARGVVFVTPQYNWGYPAPLKNAIDHLYLEWKGKPALIVSYGGHGGGKAAAQLRDVLTGIGLNLTTAMPALKLTRERIEANDGLVEPDTDFAAQRHEVIAALREFLALPGQGA